MNLRFNFKRGSPFWTIGVFTNGPRGLVPCGTLRANLDQAIAIAARLGFRASDALAMTYLDGASIELVEGSETAVTDNERAELSSRILVLEGQIREVGKSAEFNDRLVETLRERLGLVGVLKAGEVMTGNVAQEIIDTIDDLVKAKQGADALYHETLKEIADKLEVDLSRGPTVKGEILDGIGELFAEIMRLKGDAISKQELLESALERRDRFGAMLDEIAALVACENWKDLDKGSLKNAVIGALANREDSTERVLDELNGSEEKLEAALKTIDELLAQVTTLTNERNDARAIIREATKGQYAHADELAEIGKLLSRVMRVTKPLIVDNVRDLVECIIEGRVHEQQGDDLTELEATSLQKLGEVIRERDTLVAQVNAVTLERDALLADCAKLKNANHLFVEASRKAIGSATILERTTSTREAVARYYAEYNLAGVNLARAQFDERLAGLMNRGELSEQDTALIYFLKTGREDYLKAFKEGGSK